MRVIEVMRETIADILSATPSSEQMRGLWVKWGLKGEETITPEEMYEFFDLLL